MTEPTFAGFDVFKPSYNVFTDNPMISCECGWDWEGGDDSTLTDMVRAAQEHLGDVHGT